MRPALFVLSFAASAALAACSGTSDVSISEDQSISAQPNASGDGRGIDPGAAPISGDPTGANSATGTGGTAGSGTSGPNDPTAPRRPMSFFITSVSAESGGNLGGLAGADKRCQDLAGAAGAGTKTWHAYLGTTGVGGVNARDRIGAGPWANQKGDVVAMSVSDLHTRGLAPDKVLDEKGATMPVRAHNDVFTGSDKDGNAVLTTCGNWSVNAGTIAQATVGHTDAETTKTGGDRWNVAHNVSCAPGADIRLYCFAID